MNTPIKMRPPERPEIEAQLKGLSMEAMDVFQTFPRAWKAEDRLEMTLGYEESLKLAKEKYRPLMEAATKIKDHDEKIATMQRLREEMLASVPNPAEGIPDSEYQDDQ